MFALPSATPAPVPSIFSRFVRSGRPKAPAIERRTATTSDPIVDMNMPTTTMTVRQTHRKRHGDLELPNPPPIPLPFMHASFDRLIQKLNLCENRCDFTDLVSDLTAKEIKAATLREIDSLFQDRSVATRLPNDVFQALFRMVSANIFRGIPATEPGLLNGIEEPSLTDIAWPHLSLVYSILLHYQQSNITNDLFGHAFFLRILDNLAAPDRSERDMVLTYVDKHVAAHKDTQGVLLSKFAHFLWAYRSGLMEPYPVTPILKYYSMHWKDPGVAAAERRDRIRPQLFELLMVKHLKSLFAPITQLFDVAIETDRKLCADLVKAALKRWPEQYPSKQKVFLDLVVFLVERLPHNRLEIMLPDIFGLFASCAQSLHRDVVQCSFKIWGNMRFIGNILDLTPRVFPLIYEAIVLAGKTHWNSFVRKDAVDTLGLMRKVDHFHFDAEEQRYRKARRNTDMEPKPLVSSATKSRFDREKSWMMIIRLAGVYHSEMMAPRIMAMIQRALKEQGRGHWSDGTREILERARQTWTTHRKP